MIGVDSLRADRTKFGGYKYNTCPAINEMASHGIHCVNAVSNSGPTQFAYPSIVSSSSPLDFGGYDEGVMDRPEIISETFSQLGYKTFSFGADCWTSKVNGYNRGYESFENVYDVDTIWKNAKIYLSYYRKLLKEKAISENEYVNLSYKFLEKNIIHTIHYCDDELSNECFNNGKYNDLYPYDFKIIKQIFEKELTLLRKNKELYVDSLPDIELPIEGLWVADASYYYPEDRGISESIRFGRMIADSVFL